MVWFFERFEANQSIRRRFQSHQLIYSTSSHKSWQPSSVFSRDSHALQLHHHLNFILNISYNIYNISTLIMVDLHRFLTHFITFRLVDIIPWMVRSKIRQNSPVEVGRLSQHLQGSLHPRRWARFLSIFHQCLVLFTYELLAETKRQENVGFYKPKNGSIYIRHLPSTVSRWWFQTFFYFEPYLGKIPILTNIFEMGWNHQLGINLCFLPKVWVATNGPFKAWARIICGVPLGLRNLLGICGRYPCPTNCRVTPPQGKRQALGVMKLMRIVP